MEETESEKFRDYQKSPNLVGRNLKELNSGQLTQNS